MVLVGMECEFTYSILPPVFNLVSKAIEAKCMGARLAPFKREISKVRQRALVDNGGVSWLNPWLFVAH